MNNADWKNRPEIKWLSWAAILIAIAVVGYHASHRGVQSLRRVSQHESLREEGVRVCRELDSGYFRRAIVSATSAADSRMVRRFIKEGTDKSIVDGVLDVLKDATEAEIVYVMNASGMTIASTSFVEDSGQVSSLLGKNYEFRPYFRRAMRGELVIYPALGVTTGKRGVYCSAPVRGPEGEEPMGCVVIKLGLAQVDRVLNELENGAFLMTASGVIFASNRKGWMYKSHPDLGEGDINVLMKSRQFADQKIVPLNFDPSAQAEMKSNPPRLFSYHDITIFEGRTEAVTWNVGLRAEVDPAFPMKPQQRQFVIVVVSGTIIFVFIIIFLLWLSQQHARMLDMIAASEEKYRSLSHNLPVGVYRNTPGDDGHIIEANPALAAMFRVDNREQLFGVNILQLCPDEETRKTLRKRMMEEGSIYRQEVNFQRNDGTEFFAAITAKAVRDELGNILHYDGLIEDITERRKVEQALLESEQRFREIFNATDESIFVLDLENASILNVNEAVTKMYGLTRDEALSMTFSSLSSNVAPYDHRNLLNRLARIVTEGPQLFEWRAKQKTGDLFWVEVALRRTNIMGTEKALAVVRDISKRKDAEEELREKQDRLKQVEKMESIGQLAGGIAHDFNNMLAGISGAAEVLEARTSDDDRLKPLTRIITETSRRAAELTQKLLVFSSKHSPTIAPVELNSIADEAIKLLERSIDKQIVIQKKLDAEHAVMEGDRAALQNAILNLGINARDAISESGRITISTENLKLTADDCDASPFSIQPGQYVKLVVQDDGVGISPELKHQIFEPFFTTKGVGQGTGLGLAAVHSTIVEHGGAIELESEVGGGSSFTVFLPVKDEQLDKTETLPDAVRGTGEILLVDDEIIIRTMGKAMLEDLGYVVTVAEDGDIAVNIYRQKKDQIDVVLLDLVMPNMGGRDAFEEMQKINPDVKVIICSGYSMGQSIEELLEMGALQFLQKPYRRAELSRALANILGM